MPRPFFVDPETAASVLAEHPNVLALTIVVPLDEGITPDRLMDRLASFLSSLPPYTSAPAKPHLAQRDRFARFLARRQLERNPVTEKLFDTLAGIDWNNDQGCKTIAWMVLKPPPPDASKGQKWELHYSHGVTDAADLAMLSRADARKLCEHPRNNRHGQPTKKAQVIFDKLEKWLRNLGIEFLD